MWGQPCTKALSLNRSSANASLTTMISLWTRVVASGMIEWAQKAISLPVSLVSPRPLFDRNHCLLSSTNETRQMGTFKAVPQSAVMRSNSWWRGVSSLRAVWDGWPGARRRGGASRRRLGWMAGGRAAEGCAASPGGGGAVSQQDAGFVQLQTSQRRHALVLVLRDWPRHG